MTPLLDAYALGLGAAVAAMPAPGPKLAAVVLATVAGGVLGTVAWMAAARGLGALIEAEPRLIVAMQIAGGGHLPWLAAQGFKAGFGIVFSAMGGALVCNGLRGARP